MGTGIKRTSFSEEDFVAFAGKLRACLAGLRTMLARPSFGVGEMTVGAELELYLVDAQGRPARASDEVLQALGDPLFTHELDTFNVELNAPYGLLRGRPMQMLESELESAMTRLREVSSRLGLRSFQIGILPTLELDDLDPSVLTDAPRYRVLDAALRKQRGADFRLQINGADPLDIEMPHVTPEGAATSWQLHLRVDPEEFRDTYNAAQLVLGPVLAVCGNSPFFLGHRLWQETRIALFKKAVDCRMHEQQREHVPARVSFGSDWVHEDVAELFEREINTHAVLLPECHDEDPMAVAGRGGVPGLHELRLHNSTVWWWNRPVYDDAGDGHIRIELRALPAGPTNRDMLANSALILGLTLAMRSRSPARLLPFDLAHSNFYRAAEHGLDAELWWPGEGDQPVAWNARELVTTLIPLARQGLLEAGVDPADCARHLEPIEGRLQNGQTGARWQLQTFARLASRGDRKSALVETVARYHELSIAGQPVYTWPVVPE